MDNAPDPTRTTDAGPVFTRVAIGLLTILLPVLQLSAQSNATGGKPQERVEIVRQALAEWAEARKAISKEREDWRLGKQTLTAQMDVVRREIESLDKRIADARKNIAETEEKFGQLEKEESARKVVADVMAGKIAELEASTKTILPRLPAPLAANVQPISQRLPDNDEQANSLSLSERYMNVIGVLNAITKWNREVSVQTEVREMANGTNVQVAVIYVGLGQAYYVGARNKDGVPSVAGIGSVGPKGWSWSARNDLAPAIDKALSIYQNKELATLVRLPVTIL